MISKLTFGGDWEIPNIYHFSKARRSYLCYNGKKLFFVHDLTFYSLPWIAHQHDEFGTEVCLPVSSNPAALISAAKDLVSLKHTIWHSFTSLPHGGHFHIGTPFNSSIFLDFGRSYFKISPYFLELFCNSYKNNCKSYRIRTHGTQHKKTREAYCRYRYPVLTTRERTFDWVTYSRAIKHNGLEVRFPDLPKTPSTIIAIFAIAYIVYKELDYLKNINPLPVDLVDKLLDLKRKPEYIYTIGDSKVLKLLESYKYYSPEEDKYLNFPEFISQCKITFIPKQRRKKPGKYAEFFLYKFRNPILENYYKIDDRILKKLKNIKIIKK